MDHRNEIKQHKRSHHGLHMAYVHMSRLCVQVWMKRNPVLLHRELSVSIAHELHAVESKGALSRGQLARRITDSASK